MFFHLAESHQQRHGRVAFLWKWNFNNLHTLAVNFHTIPAVLFLYSNKLGSQHTAGDVFVYQCSDYCGTVKIRVNVTDELQNAVCEVNCYLKSVDFYFNYAWFLMNSFSFFKKIDVLCKKFSDRSPASIIYLY